MMLPLWRIKLRRLSTVIIVGGNLFIIRSLWRFFARFGRIESQRGIPGLERQFTPPKKRPPNPDATTAMGRISYSPGTDCSEIAEDILSAAGDRGKILRIDPPVGNTLTLLEDGEIEPGFIYHEVYTDGRYVFDPRLNDRPILMKEWQTLIKYLNPGAQIQ
ncbi:MAG: hypothetical protein EBE86_005515 [Hormoscilla sp. GUM202]|nr:hypothetical protein [Hormoscilla sp. GUM202]